MLRCEKSSCVPHGVSEGPKGRNHKLPVLDQNPKDPTLGTGRAHLPTEGDATVDRGDRAVQNGAGRRSEEISLRRLWSVVHEDCSLRLTNYGVEIPESTFYQAMGALFTLEGIPTDEFDLFTECCSALDLALMRGAKRHEWRSIVNASGLNSSVGSYLKRVALGISRAVRALGLRSVPNEAPDDRAQDIGHDIQMFRTMLLWWKRIPLSLPEHEDVLEKFLATESRIRRIEALYSNWDYDALKRDPSKAELVELIDSLREVLAEWLPPEEFDYWSYPLAANGKPRPCRCKVPTGACAEAGRGDVVTKLLALESTRIVGERFLPEHVRYPQYIGDGTELVPYPTSEWGYILPPPHLCGPAVFQTVPKAYGKLRPIAMEPVVKQWSQHGLAADLGDLFSKGGRLVAVCDYADQSRNRGMALIGSSTLCVDTIDMSEASDSNAWGLYKLVFPEYVVRAWSLVRSAVLDLGPVDVRDRPKLARLLAKCNVFWDVDWKNTKERCQALHAYVCLHKAFTSGAALCFRTQMLLYAAVCEVAYRKKNNGRPSPAFQRARKIAASGQLCLENLLYTAYVVFGDDIACMSYLTDLIVRYLRALGLRVNVQKSFIGENTHFRESCGIEALYGVDITPLRLPRAFDGHISEPKWDDKASAAESAALLDGFRDLANALFKMGMWHTRRYLLNALKTRKWGDYLYFSEVDNPQVSVLDTTYEYTNRPPKTLRILRRCSAILRKRESLTGAHLLCAMVKERIWAYRHVSDWCYAHKGVKAFLSHDCDNNHLVSKQLAPKEYFKLLRVPCPEVRCEKTPVLVEALCLELKLQEKRDTKLPVDDWRSLKASVLSNRFGEPASPCSEAAATLGQHRKRLIWVPDYDGTDSVSLIPFDATERPGNSVTPRITSSELSFSDSDAAVSSSSVRNRLLYALPRLTGLASRYANDTPDVALEAKDQLGQLAYRVRSFYLA